MGLFSKVYCDCCSIRIIGNYTKIQNPKTREHYYNLCPSCKTKFDIATNYSVEYPKTIQEVKEYIKKGSNAAGKVERIKKCNVCGFVFCYTDEDVIRNSQLQGQISRENELALTSVLAGNNVTSNQHTANAERAKLMIKDFSKCPKCNSTNLTVITKEEFNRLQNTNTADNNTVLSPTDEIVKYKELLDKGIITQEEFYAKKKQLLGL